MFAPDLVSKSQPLQPSTIPAILPILKWFVIKSKRDLFEIEVLKLSVSSSVNFSEALFNVFFNFTH